MHCLGCSYNDLTLSPTTAWHQLDASAALPSAISLPVYTDNRLYVRLVGINFLASWSLKCLHIPSAFSQKGGAKPVNWQYDHAIAGWMAK